MISVLKIITSYNRITVVNILFSTPKKFAFPVIRSCHSLKNPQEDNKLQTNISPVTVERFSQALGISEHEAIKMLTKNSNVRSITGPNLISSCKFLAERNITLEMILQHPWLLYSDSKLHIDVKLEMLRHNTKASLAATIPLLKLPVHKLRDFLEKNKVTPQEGQGFERIDFLIDKLKCDDKKACEMLIKYKFLLVVPFDRMQEMVSLLIEEAGVVPEDILKDPYILCYNPDSIKPRLEEAQSFGMTKMKPWLARSKQDIFYRSLERYKAIQEQLGSDPTTVEFLMRRLKLESPDDVTEIFRAHSRLIFCSARKLGTAITALKNEGYTCEEIVSVPRVLASSIKTVLSRLKLLRELQPHVVPTLKVLSHSTKAFNRHLNYVKSQATSGSFSIKQ
ncbi:hypothetical protein B566_EDAN005295 [Ephemera danica]|nr:hypothetical protein B566_EDAN005295 [Ephemera danica]